MDRFAQSVSSLLEHLTHNPSDPSDLDGTLRHLAHSAQAIFSADTCIIFPINPITHQYLPRPTAVGEADLLEEARLTVPRSDGNAQRVLEQGIVVIEDVELQHEYASAFTKQTSMRGLVAFSLRTKRRRRPLAVMYLNYVQSRQFGSDERRLLDVFISQASSILQETWLLRRYQEVGRIGQEINAELRSKHILFTQLCKHISEIIDTTYLFSLMIYQPQTSTLDCYLEIAGQSSQRQTPVNGVAALLLNDSERAYVFEQHVRTAGTSDVRNALLDPGGSQASVESVVAVPLKFRESVLGVVTIQHPDPEMYSQEDLELLLLLANHIALALNNLRLFDHLRLLNATAQTLTQAITLDHLKSLADTMRSATTADVVILYRYDQNLQRFELPPLVSGDLLDQSFTQPVSPTDDDIASLLVQHPTPIFVGESRSLYEQVYGDKRPAQGTFQQREQIRSSAALGLQLNGETVGVLFINFRQPQQFDAPQKILIEGLAQFAAVTIVNMRTFERAGERQQLEQNVLRRIDYALSHKIELIDVLETVLREAHTVIPAEEASILLYNRRANTLETTTAIGRSAERSKQQKIALAEARGVTGWVFANRLPKRIADIQSDPEWRDRHVAVAEDTHAELDVPLLLEGQSVGVLNFESTQPDRFSAQDQEFLVTLAGQVVVAINKAQAYEREKRIAHERQILIQISNELVRQLDLNRVLELILKSALEVTHSDVGNLMLYDSNTSDLVMEVERGVAEHQRGRHQGLDEGVVGQVARSGRLLNVADVTQPPWNTIYLPLTELPMRSELAVPIVQNGRFRGVINLESPIVDFFDDRDQRLLMNLADFAVIALQNAEQYQDKEQAAQRFEQLYAAGQMLAKLTSLSQLDEAYAIVRRLAEAHSQSQVTIRRANPAAENLEVVSASEYPLEPPQWYMSYYQGVNGQVARERRTCIIPDVADPPPDIVMPHLSGQKIRSLLVTPIQFGDYYFGNLDLSHASLGYFADADIHLFEGLAQQLALTIHRLETTHAQRELEAMGAIGQSAFELTHRLGNDLGLVRTTANAILRELAQIELDTSKINTYLQDIVEDVERVRRLAKEVREKLANDQEHEPPTSIDVRTLLEQSAAAYPYIRATVEVQIEVAPEVGPVWGIEENVADIVRNLFVNAVEAMPNGGRIMLRARNAGDKVEIQVVDTGSGIPPASLPRIFDLFYSTKGSSGFGLWSVRRNALANGGDVKVESTLGQGSTFTLVLPRQLHLRQEP